MFQLFHHMKLLIFTLVASSLHLSYGQAPPAPSWWSTPPDPVIIANPAHNKGVSNIGQAKHMVKKALDALDLALPTVAAEIRADLAVRNINLNIPSPKPSDWVTKQRAPLLIGQLKNLSEPFYNRLHASKPAWLSEQRLLNGSNQYGTHLPWTPTIASDDNNKGLASIGQLKAVFALRFANINSTIDTDGDGLSDSTEIIARTSPLISDSDGDGVADGLDVFPLDPTRSSLPNSVAGDTHKPTITITNPASLVLVSGP